MSATKKEQFDQESVRHMFNRMADAYTFMPKLLSLGFIEFWRNQALSSLDLQPGDNVADLMAGTGEAWSRMLKGVGDTGSIHAIDFSQDMVRVGEERKKRLGAGNITVTCADVLRTEIKDESMDAAFSGYGVKTLPADTYDHLARETFRILKPGARATFIEASLPDSSVFHKVYETYCRLGFFAAKLLMGERANDFANFMGYVASFGNCRKLKDAFEAAGFDVQYKQMFTHGATAIVAQKPALEH